MSSPSSPPAPSILTVRLIRSLEYRNWRPIVIRDCDLATMTWGILRERIRDALVNSPLESLPSPFRNAQFYDAIKLETDPTSNNAKSNNALINLQTPVIDLTDDSESLNQKLEEFNVKNEAELSLFNMKDYNKYLASGGGSEV